MILKSICPKCRLELAPIMATVHHKRKAYLLQYCNDTEVCGALILTRWPEADEVGNK